MNSYSTSWWSLLLINRPCEDERLSWPCSRMVYPYKWLPISCRFGADQWKFAGQRPTFYHWATRTTGAVMYYYSVYKAFAIFTAHVYWLVMTVPGQKVDPGRERRGSIEGRWGRWLSEWCCQTGLSWLLLVLRRIFSLLFRYFLLHIILCMSVVYGPCFSSMLYWWLLFS